VNDPSTTARTISEWPAATGVPLSPTLASACNAWHETEFALTAPRPTFDASRVTPAHAESAVNKFAAELATAGAWNEARTIALRALAGRVIDAAAAEVPALIEKLRPEFDLAVVEYVDAVAELPDSFNGDQIAAAHEDVQAAYRKAGDAAKTIRRIDSWLGSLSGIPGVSSHTPDRELKVLSPTTRAELRDAMTEAKVSKAEASLVPLYLNAARRGIAFEMKTPAEATALRKQIDSMPIVRENEQRLVSFGR